MKQYIAFLTIVLALAACKKAQPTGAQYLAAPVLETSTGTVQFSSEGGKSVVSATTFETLEAKTAQTWLTVAVEGHDVTLTAAPNASIESRYAIVELKSAGASRSVQVVQFGYNTTYLWQDGYNFPGVGGVLNLRYANTDATIRVKVSDNWISAAASDGILTITVAENPEAEPREGSIEWIAGDDNRTIVITQEKGSGSSGGDEPGGDDEPGEVTYASWIGSWSSSAGTLVISELSEADHIYVMSFEQFGEQNVPAFFNEETGALEFYSYEIGTEGNWTYWFCSFDSDDYIETGGPDNDIMLASATLNAAKTAFTIEGNEYTAVYGGTSYDEVIVQLIVAGYLSEDEGNNTAGWYTFNDMEPVDLPAAYTKAGTTSVKNTPLVLAPKYGNSSIKQLQTR